MAMSLIVIFGMALIAFLSARRRARNLAGHSLARLHSQPSYHGFLGAISWLLPAAFVYGILFFFFTSQISQPFMLFSASGTGALAHLLFLKTLHRKLKARPIAEFILQCLVAMASGIAILATLGIILSLAVEAFRFFTVIPVDEFLFGLNWSPQIALRPDQVGSSGAFGILPLFTGTLLITCVALSIAVPIGLMAAIYLSDYASPALRAWLKPMIELLAGIPTVVYGFFAALFVGPALRKFGLSLGWDIASESALAAGLVMGVMIIPFVSSVADDVMNAVPQALRDGSLAMGATKSETIVRVVIPAALPGIAGGILLATSRAVGETMIVVMAAGLAAHLTFNPLEATTTITVQIVTLLTGDQEFDSPKTLAAFALGLALFIVTLALNFASQKIVQRFKEQYE